MHEMLLRHEAVIAQLSNQINSSKAPLPPRLAESSAPPHAHLESPSRQLVDPRTESAQLPSITTYLPGLASRTVYSNNNNSSPHMPNIQPLVIQESTLHTADMLPRRHQPDESHERSPKTETHSPLDVDGSSNPRLPTGFDRLMDSSSPRAERSGYSGVGSPHGRYAERRAEWVSQTLDAR
jgi:hypothetical protein